MRVYIEQADEPSHALARVDAALQRYAPPSVLFLNAPELAELVILPAIGRRNRVTLQAVEHLDAGRRVAVIQYCVRSTKTPSTQEWRTLWQSAALVWSYYDLPEMIREDGGTWTLRNFYHSPLGADADVFKPPVPNGKPYVVCTSGRGWLTESARECAYAAKAMDGRVLHLGPNMKRPWVDSVSGLTDEQLAEQYGLCHFVSGLRRIEGFELPAVEGLLCGTRPLAFDKPHYRQWFGDLADYIPERPREDVLADLTEVFRVGPRPVTAEERAVAVERFNWARIVKGFWDRL